MILTPLIFLDLFKLAFEKIMVYMKWLHKNKGADLRYWKISVLLLMSLIWPGSSAVAAQAMTLVQCVVAALEDNPTLEASRL